MAKIKTQAQYDWAVKRVEELLPLVPEDAPENDDARIELELLSELVSEYSLENYSIGEPSLVDVLKLRMYELGLTQKALADILGISPSRLSDLLSGKCEPTIKTARIICSKLDVDASVVLGV